MNGKLHRTTELRLALHVELLSDKDLSKNGSVQAIKIIDR